MASVKTLIELADADAEKARLEHELNKLPQAKKIMDCRTKRKELKGKQDQVVELADETESKIAKLQAEEERVIAKINELQATLDTSKDYRVTQSVTRDMEGQVKRQASIASEQNELLERQIKIDNLAEQVSGMLEKLDHEEHHLTEDFKKEGGKIKAQIEKISDSRSKLLAEVEYDVARRYEQLREEKGGIALARLEGDHCTVCSTTILTGQLDKLRRGPALSECPNCHRLMVVREDEED